MRKTKINKLKRVSGGIQSLNFNTTTYNELEQKYVLTGSIGGNLNVEENANLSSINQAIDKNNFSTNKYDPLTTFVKNNL